MKQEREEQCGSWLAWTTANQSGGASAGAEEEELTPGEWMLVGFNQQVREVA